MDTNVRKVNTKAMAQMGLLTAVLCILAPITIPIGTIPISLTNFILFLMIYILGMKKTMISYSIYICIGLVGLPVFSGFSGGIFKFIGPTGGYLIGFYLLILISGIFIDKYVNNRVISILSMVLGMIFCYSVGTMWLAVQLKMTFLTALFVGVIPFLIGDVVKIVVASFIGPTLKNRVGNF